MSIFSEGGKTIVVETVLGAGMAAIHAAKVEQDDAQAMAQTLQRRRGQGLR